MILLQLCQAWYDAQLASQAAPRIVPTYDVMIGDAAAPTCDYLESPAGTPFEELPEGDKKLVEKRVIAVLNGDVPRRRLEPGDRMIWPGRARGVAVHGTFATFYDTVTLKPRWEGISGLMAFNQPEHIGFLQLCNLQVPGHLIMDRDYGVHVDQLDARVCADDILTPERAQLALLLLERTLFTVVHEDLMRPTGKLIEIYRMPWQLNRFVKPRERFRIWISCDAEGTRLLEMYGQPLHITLCLTGNTYKSLDDWKQAQELRKRTGSTLVAAHVAEWGHDIHTPNH